MARPYHPAVATIDDFLKLDLRVGVVVSTAPLDRARKPSYVLDIDFGPLGHRRSVAALRTDYPDPSLVTGRQVVTVFNFPPRRVAGVDSEVLVLAATEADGSLRLLSPDPPARLGSHIS